MRLEPPRRLTLLMLSSLIANSVHELYAMSYPSPANSYLLTYNPDEDEAPSAAPGYKTWSRHLGPDSTSVHKRWYHEKADE